MRPSACRHIVAATFLVSTFACQVGRLSIRDGALDGVPSETAVGDGALVDSGASDGALETGVVDTGIVDTGIVDTGVVDTGIVDTGFVDSGVTDSGVPDTGVPDTGVSDTGVSDTGVGDAGVTDTGVADAQPADSGVDSGVADSGAPDSGIADSGVADSGVADSGVADSGLVDTGAQDTGVADAGVADSGVADTGVADTGVADSGVDAGTCTVTVPALARQSIVTGVASPFSDPIYLTQAPGETDALWVVERAGTIQVVRGGVVSLFLDMTSLIGSAPGGGDERGLHSMAFHPDWPTDRRFYVAYTPTNAGGGRNVVGEFTTTMADRYVANTTEVRRLVDITDPEGNHNGGQIAFGPDRFLYYATGDGGGGGDAHGSFGNGLDLSTLLGKILRLDVDNVAGEFAAAGNPFPNPTPPQIWAYGLRNPWRFSFDRLTGDLYLGDVGQGSIEEIDFQPASSTGGENYGWRAYEGNSVYDSANTFRVPNHAAPIAEVSHSSARLPGACAISGGFVYRGTVIPELDGVYFFGDYCANWLGALRRCPSGEFSEPIRVAGWSRSGGFVSLGQDNAGEIYVVYIDIGEVYRIVPAP